MIKSPKIPSFPTFKFLELEDRQEIETYTYQFEPYSDYNFVSLWSYDIKKEIQISKLNDNLIVRFTDYLTGEPQYSFLGTKSLEHTIHTLLEHTIKIGVKPQLKLIPEITISNNPKISSLFQVVEDRDNFDHIYSTQDMSMLSGTKYENKRYKVNLFKRNYPNVEVSLMSLTDELVKKNILDVFEIWAKHKELDSEQTIHEYTAIQNLLNNSDKFDLICLGIWDKNKLIGFSITEITHHGYSIFHFTKADRNYKGIFEYLYYQTAQELYKRECTLLNREQDLGIAELRVAKESWRPIKFLKKYTISHKQKL